MVPHNSPRTRRRTAMGRRHSDANDGKGDADTDGGNDAERERSRWMMDVEGDVLRVICVWAFY